jgi:hypothetical protein
MSAIEYVHHLPCYPSKSSPLPSSGACESGWCGLCLSFYTSIMIASDDASVASKDDKIDRQKEWRTRMKEEAKRSAQNQLRDWVVKITLDDIVLSADGTTIAEIDAKPTEAYNMVFLRAFCSKLKINGYKNKRRDETIRLLLERKRVQLVESAHYSGGECTNNLTVAVSTESILSDVSSPGAAILPCSPETRSMSRSRLALSNATAAEAVSSPETRSMARSRRAASDAESSLTTSTSKKPLSSKKQGKGTVPSFVAHDGTYYRAINVWFDERHRSDIMTMGASPSMQDLDTRQFANKKTYDKLLLTYMDSTTENDAVNFVCFSPNEFLDSCGINDDQASTFDVLDSKQLKQVLDYIVHHYKISHRNNQTSGNHADFHQFVGCRPFVYYYHLWLREIPHLSYLAVPALGDSVRQASTDVDDKKSSVAFGDGDTTTGATESVTSSSRAKEARQKRGYAVAASATNERAAQILHEQQQKKLKVVETHLKAMEDIERERTEMEKDGMTQRNKLSLTSELKAVEEMVSMKRREVEEASSLPSDRQKKAAKQLRQLERRRDQIMDTLYGNESDDSDHNSN